MRLHFDVHREGVIRVALSLLEFSLGKRHAGTPDQRIQQVPVARLRHRAVGPAARLIEVAGRRGSLRQGREAEDERFPLRSPVLPRFRSLPSLARSREHVCWLPLCSMARSARSDVVGVFVGSDKTTMWEPPPPFGCVVPSSPPAHSSPLGLVLAALAPFV